MVCEPNARSMRSSSSLNALGSRFFGDHHPAISVIVGFQRHGQNTAHLRVKRWKKQSERFFGGIENAPRLACRKKLAQEWGSEGALPQLSGSRFVEAAERESLRLQ